MDANPALSYSSETREQVTVAMTRVTSEGQIRLAYSTFFPWVGWPASGTLSAPIAAFATTSTVFAAGAGSDGHWSVLFDSAGSSGFAPHIKAQSAGAGPVVTLGGHGRRFVARGAPHVHLVGTASAGTLHTHVVTSTSSGSNLGVLSRDMGCDNADPIADATAFADGWLVAFSDWAGSITDCGGLSPETAKRLNIAKVGADATASMIASMDVGGPIAEIHAVPHPDGIQLAFRRMGLAGEPIQIVRVGVLDGLVVGPTVITPPGAAPREGFAAASLGTDIAVAWVDGLPGSPGELRVAVRDGSGAETATLSLGTVNSVGPIAAIGAPDMRSLVLAWATDTRVRLARLDCSEP